MQGKLVVLGGAGLIGHSMVKALNKQGYDVRYVDYIMPDINNTIAGVEYSIGDVRDKSFFSDVLKEARVVMDFIAPTMPNSGDISLNKEISSALDYHDYVLSMMAEHDVRNYVFPSSGGTVYGSIEKGKASETDILNPSTPYGAGKMLAEDIIKYYNSKADITSFIFRLGNVYGSPNIRRKAQGIIDLFVQKALRGEKIVLWRGARNVIRDYVFLDDAIDGMIKTLQKKYKQKGVFIYNIATGEGVNTETIIKTISEKTGKELIIENEKSLPSGINRIVLSSEKIHEEIGWKAKTSIEGGIEKTIELKETALGVISNGKA